MHVSEGLVRNRERMNWWTFFSTHGIVPRGLEDAGVKKTTSAPAKAAAIPCRSKERGVCKGRDGRDCEWSCPVRPQRPSPLDDSTLQRPHSACCHCLRRVDGMADGMDGLAAVAVASGRRHSNLNNRLTIETRKGGSHSRKRHTQSRPQRERGSHRRRQKGKASYASRELLASTVLVSTAPSR